MSARLEATAYAVSTEGRVIGTLTRHPDGWRGESTWRGPVWRTETYTSADRARDDLVRGYRLHQQREAT
jgi:hypothetical protein